MSILEDFSVNAGIFADKISRKADTAVEISRLKITEKRIRSEISKSLKLLGAKVYKAYSTGETNPDVGEDVTSVRDMYDRLKAVRVQIAELKEKEFTKETDKKEKTSEV